MCRAIKTGEGRESIAFHDEAEDAVFALVNVQRSFGMERPGLRCVLEQGVILQHCSKFLLRGYCRILETAIDEMCYARGSKEGVGMRKGVIQKSLERFLCRVIYQKPSQHSRRAKIFRTYEQAEQAYFPLP